MLAPGRAKPKPTPETRHFWDGTKGGQLRGNIDRIKGLER